MSGEIKRDENGKFTKGTGGGPGRPKREREAQYYRILEMAVSADDWSAICCKAVEQAKRGDAVARKFIADYLLGTPPQRIEHSGEDGKAMEIVVRYVNGRTDA